MPPLLRVRKQAFLRTVIPLAVLTLVKAKDTFFTSTPLAARLPIGKQLPTRTRQAISEILERPECYVLPQQALRPARSARLLPP
jgi:hypothetical protein